MTANNSLDDRTAPTAQTVQESLSPLPLSLSLHQTKRPLHRHDSSRGDGGLEEALHAQFGELSLVGIVRLVHISIGFSHEGDVEKLLGEVVEGDVEVASLDSGEDVVDGRHLVNGAMELLELLTEHGVVIWAEQRAETRDRESEEEEESEGVRGGGSLTRASPCRCRQRHRSQGARWRSLVRESGHRKGPPRSH
jgi:hypothetical protein